MDTLPRGMWMPIRPAPSLFSIPWQYVQSSQCSQSVGESLSTGSLHPRHLGNWLLKCSFNRIIERPRMPLQESFSSDSVLQEDAVEKYCSCIIFDNRKSHTESNYICSKKTLPRNNFKHPVLNVNHFNWEIHTFWAILFYHTDIVWKL